MPETGGGLSGFGQQLGDILGGLLGSADDALPDQPELDEPPGLDDPDDLDEPDDADADDEDDADPDEADVASGEEPDPASDAGLRAENGRGATGS